MTETLRLHYAPDNASLCVRLALEAANIPYDTSLVDRGTQQQKSAAYKALNPNGLIPTLETPDGPLFETGAILLWLADQTPGTLFPAATDTPRGRALTWLFWLANTLHPTLRMSFYPANYGPDADALRKAAKERLTDQLTLLNDKWTDIPTAGILECYTAPMLRWCALYGGDTAWFDITHWPALHHFARSFENKGFARRAAQAEGLGETPFSDPGLPNPPEGTAL